MSHIPEKKSSFQKMTFTEPQYGGTITLISETECEIGNSGNIILGEYSREDNRLRVVTRALGQASVRYLEILPDGLRASSEEVYLMPEPLKKWREKARLDREAEAARQRAAQEEQARIALEKEKTIMAAKQKADEEERRKEEDARRTLPPATVPGTVYVGTLSNGKEIT